mmetsp:Transcript_8901/g.27279  ORF Transcript_8901/g.27279 Transcript_8901/m.27279 type:complete len:233 (+) Transcript_8901:1025-1723(+)
MLLTHRRELGLVVRIDTVEYGVKCPVKHVEYLMVVFMEGHLHVQPHKFGHVAVGEGVLGPEHRRHLKDAVEVGHQRHLLVELRRLRQVGIATKVFNLEHVGATFRGGADKFWRMDLCEVLREEEGAKILANSRLETHDGLVRRCAQVNDTIVEPDVEAHTNKRRVRGELHVRACCVFYEKRQRRHGAGDAVEALYLQLHGPLRACLNRHLGNCDLTIYINDRLLRDRGRETD